MQLATGLYCPGCGGTRSVLAFLMGYIKVSFYFHPLILYSASVFATYMLTSTITYLSKGKVNLLIGFQSIFIYIGFGIIMANWIVRDILLVVYHIPIG